MQKANLNAEINMISNKIKEQDWNPYSVLGLEQDASSGQIKKAYFTAARDFHPDRAGSEEEANAMKEKFQAFGEAYEALSHPDKKVAVDQALAAKETPKP
ncbi:MAG: J domain-containing protein [Gammaproteobacteria bacterium]